MTENNWLLNDSVPVPVAQEFSLASAEKAWGWFGMPAAGEGSEFETPSVAWTEVYWTPFELAFNGGGAPPPVTLSDAGNIASEEAFGTPELRTTLSSAGAIPSAEAFGTPDLRVTLADAGAIPSAETFGAPELRITLAGAGNISSAEAFDSPASAVFLIDAGNIASAEAFGTSSLAVILEPIGIPSAEAFDVPMVSIIRPVGERWPTRFIIRDRLRERELEERAVTKDVKDAQ